jgi:hypothetical protein
LNPVQKRILLALTLLAATTRLLAAAASLWDWDEALFALAVRDYDVTRHHPHPPGYPLFIAAGKLVHLFVADEFRALQVVVILAACALLPLLFALARELGFSFATSVSAATLFAFLPNVWVYGGTAFSDVPAVAAGLAACTLLLRGRRDPRAFVLGAIVLGLAAGIRLPNLLLGATPALLATWSRVRARQYGVVMLAMLLGALTVAACYLGAAVASTTVPQFLEALREQSAWVREVDSWRNPQRPPLREMAELFWFKPVANRWLNRTIAILGAVSVLAAMIRRRVEVLQLFLLFGPLAVMAWLTLDFTSVSRYAIAYMPAHAIVAADGMGVLARRFQPLLASMLILWSAIWTFPAIREQRAHPAPPVAAFEYALRSTPPSTILYVNDGLGPHAELLLGDRRRNFFQPHRPVSTIGGDGVVIDYRRGAVNFERQRGRLWDIVRQRNFEASVTPVRSPLRWGHGWYGVENEPEKSFRWMSGEATVTLSHLEPAGTLSIGFSVPAGTRPQVDLFWNDALVERFRVNEPRIEKEYRLASRPGGNELRIRTSETVQPGHGDTRPLGLRFDEMAWTR